MRLLARALDLEPDEAAALAAAASRRRRHDRGVALAPAGVGAGTYSRPGPGVADSAAPAPPPPAASVTASLPAPLSSFVGRERELAAVQERLLDPRVRLLTLTGAGGTGKTRLALRAAEGVRAAFPGGLCHVPLSALAEPALVPDVIARALGLEPGEGRPPEAVVAQFLRGRRVLLLLDGFEHLLPAAPAVAALLEACPTAKALITSRAVLRLSGEHGFPVPPLPLPAPPDGRLPDRDRLAAVADSDAVRLFVDRARAARPGFALCPENIEPIAELCRRLDGLPLALELAAARCRHFGPEELLRRLRSPAGGLPLLTGGPQDQPARQRTLRATMAWSHGLLPPEQQALFRRLAIFAGGWTAAAAAALDPAAARQTQRPRDDVPFPQPSTAPGPEAERAAAELRALDGLAALVDHSLVQVEDAGPSDGATDARYRMLDTVREFARELLADAGEADATARRHAAACLELAEAAFGPLHGADQLAWLARLDREQPNVRAALGWCLDAGRRGDAAAQEVGLRLAGTLGCWYWRLWAVIVEGGDWLARLLAVAESGAAGPTRGRAVALAGAGHLATETDTGRAPVLLAAAVEAARARGERWLEAFAQALLAHRTRDLPEARRRAAAALAAFQDLGDTWGTAWALRFVADPLRAGGDLGGAWAALAQAAQGARAAGDRFLEAWSLLPMAALAAQRGDAAAARRLLEQSLVIRHALGDRHGVRVALLTAANNAVLAGDVAAAAAHARAAVAVSRELDGRGTPAKLLLWMASYVAGTSAAARVGDQNNSPLGKVMWSPNSPLP